MDSSLVTLAYRCALEAYAGHPVLRKAVHLVGAETLSDHELPEHVEGLRKEANELRDLVAAMGCAADLKSAMESVVKNQTVTIEALRSENEALKAERTRLAREMEERVSAERTANNAIVCENARLTADYRGAVATIKAARKTERWASFFSKLSHKSSLEGLAAQRRGLKEFVARRTSKPVIAWGRHLSGRPNLHS